MTNSRTPQEGRAAFDRRAWSQACEFLAGADAQTPLEPEDLDRLATAAYLIGNEAVSIQARSRAYAGFLERGETIRAARSAFWLAFLILDNPSQRSQAAGWLARAQRLIDDANEPCVEEGWLLCATARQRVGTGDLAAAYDAFTKAVEIGERFRDSDLMALARHGEGRALLVMNKRREGLALLDEVMVAVTSGEIAPVIAGAVYCSVITACVDIFDLRRAQEWTAALDGWCAAQPDIVPYRGHCLIRRSEIMQLHGAWPQALAEARRACDRITDPSQHSEGGSAHYQLAELYRLRGDLASAEEAYRMASQLGRKPQPGLALLRLAQGDAGMAAASIRLALQETGDQRTRVLLQAAAVEIMLAANDVAAARECADKLGELAARLECAFVEGTAAQARGAVELAEGQSMAALQSLRTAAATWRELDGPYELAQVRVLIGLACRQLGDHDGAQLELDAALETFEKLGAASAAARVGALMSDIAPQRTTALTGREIEVLRLVATGATNRAIGTRLEISEKTVARHVSNIFTKLDLPSRAAATAYAYEHKLL